MQDNPIITQRDPLPENFDSIEEFWEFWDTHSSADYEDLMEDVHFEVNIKVHFAVAKALREQLHSQARKQGISTETLVNLWLQEKVNEVTHRPVAARVTEPESDPVEQESISEIRQEQVPVAA